MPICVILDLDGTLLDSLQDLEEAANYALRMHGLPQRSTEEIRAFVGNGVRRLMERAVPDGTSNETFTSCFDAFKAYYALHCNDHTRPYAGIQDTLHSLKGRGVRMAIVSNKIQHGVDALHQAWFADTIEVAIGDQDGMKRKPAPDMVHRALELLLADTPREDYRVLYVGDSEVDVETAHNANIPCLSALWGFRDRDTLLSAGATTFLKSPSDILTFI